MKKKTLFADVLQTVTRYFLVLVILVLVGIACSGIRVVESGNVALILRFGKLVGDTPEEQIHEPGLLLAFPYVVDEVIIVPTGSVMEQSVTTYYTPDDTPTKDGSYVITGNQNVAILAASVKYTISDPVAYALNVNDITAIINGCVSNAMLSQAAQIHVDSMLGAQKDTFAASALKEANAKISQAEVGVTLKTLEVTTSLMPSEVREIYSEVTSAKVEASTILVNAENYKQSLIPNAQATAGSRVAVANAEYAVATAKANNALVEFWGVLEEYRANPQVVTARILNEKTQAILAKVGKVRVVQEGEAQIWLMPEVEDDGES